MPLFGRKKAAVEKAPQEEEAPPVPDSLDVLNGPHDVFYTVRDPWQWVMQEVAEGSENVQEVQKAADLPTGKIAAAAAVSASADGAVPTPLSAPQRRRRKKPVGPCTLRIEVPDANGEIIEAVHGSSEALDGLEDKDELVRTIQRCRCEHLELSPPSRLLNWDVTKEECMNLVGASLPGLVSNEKDAPEERIAVLKEPMGSQGTGVFFVKDAVQIHEIIDEHRKRAVAEPEFLDNLIAIKGRIPSWVLQAEVHPALLIHGRRKFHLRTYVVVVEKAHSESLMESFVYNRHEVRIASEPVPKEDSDTGNRDRTAHITNGGYSKQTERVLLHEEPELAEKGLQAKLETFVAQALQQHFAPDMLRRVSLSQDEGASPAVRKFAVAGLDLMVTEDLRIYLLEVNVNPASPPADAISEGFKNHLVGFMKDLIDLVVGKPTPNFVPATEILDRKS